MQGDDSVGGHNAGPRRTLMHVSLGQGTDYQGTARLTRELSRNAAQAWCLQRSMAAQAGEEKVKSREASIKAASSLVVSTRASASTSPA